MIFEATGRIELPIRVLQTPALPLGYVAEEYFSILGLFAEKFKMRY